MASLPKRTKVMRIKETERMEAEFKVKHFDYHAINKAELENKIKTFKEEM